jgi:hypothetical protein
MARRRRRPAWKTRLAYLLTFLLTGGGAGIGSWQLRDHPILQRLVLGIRDGAAQGKTPREAIQDGLSNLLDGGDADRDGGVYEVKVADIHLDEALFSRGQTLDIQVRVIKADAQGKTQVVWDSQEYGQRRAVVGKDPLTASWADRPFRVAWTPGERLGVEIWDRYGYWDRHWLQMKPSDDDRFPLHSGPHQLVLVSTRRSPAAPETNQIVLQSRRVRDLPIPDGPGRSQPDSRPSEMIAEEPIVIR